MNETIERKLGATTAATAQHDILAGLPAVLTLEQTAEVLQIGITTARGFCREHKLPAIKVGRSWRIPKAHLADLLDKTNLR